jgi:hypothetical protein
MNRIAKSTLFLLISILISRCAFGQHIDEGCFNGWDFGPHGVYGNLRLIKIKERSYDSVEKKGPQEAIVREINPSGIVVNTTFVSFVNGILSEVDRANQWGEIYEYLNYRQKGDNVFQVTDHLRGKNVYLPCKYAIHHYTNDLLTEVQYYSFKAQLMANRDGVAVIRYKRYEDSIRFGETIETSYFDAQDKPVTSKSAGCHKLMTKYDEHDNEVSSSERGINEEPVTNQYGISGSRASYDIDNNRIEILSYDQNNNITSNASGVAGAKYEYQHGYLMKEVFLDTLGNPVQSLPSGNGVAIIAYEYDTAGNRVRESNFDAYGKPINNQSGIQETASFFSAGNMLTRVSYFDALGKPCINRDSINTTLYVKDEKNRTIQESSYGVNGQPIKTYTEEVFMLKKKYDKYGRVISTSYWADTNTLMPHWNGCYEIIDRYDEDGQLSEYILNDAQGRPFMTEDGASDIKLIYNSDGRLGERRFLHDNKLVVRKSGITTQYSIIKYGYDQNGRENEITFWGPDGNPANAIVWINDSVVAHRIVNIYKGSRIIQQEYYKIDAAEPFQTIDCLKNDYIGLSGINMGRKNAN